MKGSCHHIRGQVSHLPGGAKLRGVLPKRIGPIFVHSSHGRDARAHIFAVLHDNSHHQRD
jgi:hypothetical protein